MRRAVIDLDACLFCRSERGTWARDLGAMFEAMSIAGLNVVGSAPSPFAPTGADIMRLIVEADVARPDALPAECETGWRIVKPTFSIEQHGDQRLLRLSAIDVVGQPRLQLAA